MPIELPASVDQKPLIQLEDGTEIVDLTVPSQKIIEAQPMVNYYLVDNETAMRVDVIAQITMGSQLHIEKILKFNDISNPFTIDENFILFIPDLIYAEINLNTTSGRDRQKFDIRDQYIDPQKKSNLDPTFGKFSERNKPKKADASKTAPPLPPNFANIGDKEIEIKGGKIYLGANVSKNGNEADQPLSKSEFLAKLIKNRNR